MDKSIKRLVRETLRATLREWDAVKRQENILTKSLDLEGSRLRGVKMTDMILNPSYVKFIRGEVEIQLQHSYPTATTARAFRRGKLVHLDLSSAEESNKNEKWTRVPGIISAVKDDIINVCVRSIGDNFLQSSLRKNDDISIVEMTERSTIPIIESSAYAIKQIKINDRNRDIAENLVNENKLETMSFVSDNDNEVNGSNFLDVDKIHAVKLCAQNNPVTVIHGPPGTGKTTALAAVILSEIAKGNRVLATAPSHAAVDALIMAVSRQWNENLHGEDQKRMLRVGNILRLREEKAQRWLIKSESTVPMYENLQLVQESILQRKGDFKFLLKEEKSLLQNARSLSEKEEFDQITTRSIVFCTCLPAVKMSKRAIKKFDVVCIDEAAFAPDWLTVPIAMCGISRLILCGDHLQLPPVTTTDIPLVSLMERLANKIPTATLTQQFRSNSLISGWSSEYFYNGQLKAHESVASTCLNDLVETKDKLLSRPLIFFDTKQMKFYEEVEEISNSVCNSKEVEIVENLLRLYLQLGIKGADIGVISPYWAQVALLRNMLSDLENVPTIEASTVDGFQGCQKELIIISLVRSNPERKVGFLSESRRINVTITRAKRGCVVVGDTSTLDSDPAIKSFIRYCQKNKCLFPI